MRKKPFFNQLNRRKFIKKAGIYVGTSSLLLPQLSLGGCQPGGQEQESPSSAGNAQGDSRLGIALVGLGNYSRGQLAPALQETEKCYLAGIVTGTPAKAEEWKEKYNIPEKNIYNYDTYDQIADNEDIDIIYVVLPNGMHAEYTVRAAQAGKHVICEKPMATSVEDCRRMIEACDANNVKLSIGYRLHFEPHHQRVMELGQQEVYGPVQSLEAAHSFRLGGDPDRWRVDKELSGGGPLMDVGIYAVQGCIYSLGEEPIAVSAEFGEVTRPDFFDEVEQSISWQMEFPGGAVANCRSSYNEGENLLYGEAQNGWWRLQPAYSYGGIQGETSEGPMNIENVNQQARQMDAFAECIIDNTETRVPGEMGLRDVRIMEAIYDAAESGNKVSLS
jgi:predicted dehydrogenase